MNPVTSSAESTAHTRQILEAAQTFVAAHHAEHLSGDGNLVQRTAGYLQQRHNLSDDQANWFAGRVVAEHESRGCAWVDLDKSTDYLVTVRCSDGGTASFSAAELLDLARAQGKVTS